MSGSVTLAATETITVDFNEDAVGFAVAGATTVAGDLDFHDGTERTIVASGACSGSPQNEMQFAVNDTTGVLTLTACTGYTASAAGAVVSIEYGTAATSGTAGANRVTNPAATGSQEINIAGSFGDAAFSIDLPIVDDDQVSITASIDTYLSFDIDIGDGSHSNTNTPYAIALGELLFSAATNEGTSGVSEIYFNLDTNADGGAMVQVASANGNLTSASTSDTIPSNTDADGNDLNTSNGNYGIAVGQTTAATEGALTAVAPFNVLATGDAVGALTTSFQTIFNTGSAPIVDGDSRAYVRAVAGKSTQAADDYADTLTFRATATY